MTNFEKKSKQIRRQIAKTFAIPDAIVGETMPITKAEMLEAHKKFYNAQGIRIAKGLTKELRDELRKKKLNFPKGVSMQFRKMK